jgi:stage II sporulation protein R
MITKPGGIIMKKLFTLLIIGALVIGSFYAIAGKTPVISASESEASAEAIGKNLIRFHVIANSDSENDQNVKLEVRDAILAKVGPQLEKAQSTEAAEKYLKDNLDMIIKIANDILSKESKDYTATASVGLYEFPVKSYNSITLPAGEYTALRVVLGNGDGKNWWCVMFPPLCFIDVTQGLTVEKTDQQLSKVMTTQEVNSITTIMEHTGDTASAKTIENNKEDSSQTSSKSSESTIEFRFKTVEFIKGFINKLKQK